MIKIIRHIRTHLYCDYYLNTSYHFPKRYPTWLRDKLILRNNLDDDYVKREVRRLYYSYFLNNPYWHTIADYMKRKAKYKCKKCGKKKSKETKNELNVHHLDYELHGFEHLKLMRSQDLIVVCSTCHKKLHNLPTNKEKHCKLTKK